MRTIAIVLFCFALAVVPQTSPRDEEQCLSGNCVQFTVGQGPFRSKKRRLIRSGTGCAWICNYCAQQLGTTNYYFPDNVCTFASADLD